MKIREIKIENVRGINSKSISMDMHPNKVTFFVAPNGFGKTSIARAFGALKRNRLEIAEEDRYLEDATAQPAIKLVDDAGNVYAADNSFNTISSVFSVSVISSQVHAKATTRNLGSFSATTPSLIVDPIVLYNTIPQKQELAYSLREMQSSFGQSTRKLLINLASFVKEAAFIYSLENAKKNFLKMDQTRLASKLSNFTEALDQLVGTKEDIANEESDAHDLLEIPTLNSIAEEFDFWLHPYSDNQKLVNVIQLKKLFERNQEQFSAVVAYKAYLTEKKEIDQILSCLNCTWKNIRAVKKDGKLVLEFPKANQISNGERDVLCFVGKLFEARSKLRKDKAILVIDEIFDYLDDANLIAAQYFLTKFINAFKIEGKELFLILLTHLDPAFFNTYCFSSKNIVYLSQTGQITNKYKINDFLKDRSTCRKNDQARYDRISAHYFHYSTENIDEHVYLSSLGVEEPLHTSAGFYVSAFDELEHYKNGLAYDPILVCCGVRLKIEKAAYEQLPSEYKCEFLRQFKTVSKLEFAKEKGADIPETHFLLSIIYNEAMHLDSQCSKLNPIICKLKNKVIQKIISEL